MAGMLSFIPKVVGFVALIRFTSSRQSGGGLPRIRAFWRGSSSRSSTALVAMTMIVGNLDGVPTRRTFTG